MTPRKSFDTIVIGAGAAGCVIANRRSAEPKRSVVLVEAGSFFKQHEDYDRGTDTWHSSDGELSVQRPAQSNPLAHAFVEAAAQAGFAKNDDFNGEAQDGFGIFDLNQKNGVRWSSSRAFLRPVLGRPNLTVFADALVERIRLQGKRAVGITMRRRGQRIDLDADIEVVVCAGTVNSPQLLMLSGIGPKDGRVELVSSDPAAKPVMHPEFLEAREDVQTLQRAMREARRIVAMSALARLSGAELLPGPLVDGDSALEAFIRERVATTYHPVGTCKMGPPSDGLAVVDQELRVHGVEGLRVADASIMPNLIGRNTSAPSMMIGERAAHFILHP